MWSRIIIYALLIVLLIYAVILAISENVCDCRDCDFISQIEDTDDPEEINKQIVLLLEPFVLERIWPLCLVASFIIAFVFIWIFPLLSVVPLDSGYSWLINESLVFCLSYLFCICMFSLIQQTYLNNLIPIVTEAYWEAKNNK
jgi:hypothetical protein